MLSRALLFNHMVQNLPHFPSFSLYISYFLCLSLSLSLICSTRAQGPEPPIPSPSVSESEIGASGEAKAGEDGASPVHGNVRSPSQEFQFRRLQSLGILPANESPDLEHDSLQATVCIFSSFLADSFYLSCSCSVSISCTKRTSGVCVSLFFCLAALSKCWCPSCGVENNGKQCSTAGTCPNSPSGTNDYGDSQQESPAATLKTRGCSYPVAKLLAARSCHWFT